MALNTFDAGLTSFDTDLPKDMIGSVGSGFLAKGADYLYSNTNIDSNTNSNFLSSSKKSNDEIWDSMIDKSSLVNPYQGDVPNKKSGIFSGILSLVKSIGIIAAPAAALSAVAVPKVVSKIFGGGKKAKEEKEAQAAENAMLKQKVLEMNKSLREQAAKNQALEVQNARTEAKIDTMLQMETSKLENENTQMQQALSSSALQPQTSQVPQQNSDSGEQTQVQSKVASRT